MILASLEPYVGADSLCGSTISDTETEVVDSFYYEVFDGFWIREDFLAFVPHGKEVFHCFCGVIHIKQHSCIFLRYEVLVEFRFRYQVLLEICSSVARLRGRNLRLP